MENVLHVVEHLVDVLACDPEPSLLGVVQLPRFLHRFHLWVQFGHDSSKHLQLRGVICPVERFQVDSNTHVGLLYLYRRLPAVVNAGSRVAGLCPKFAFDFQKAVVLRDAFAAAG